MTDLGAMTEQELKEEVLDNEEMQPESAAAESDEVAKLKQEKLELLDRLARLQAEFDNYRKRLQREQDDFRQYAVADAVKAFLPIIDNFNLALKHDTGNAEELRKGVELIRKQMEDALSRLGVQVIEAHGSEFDPHHHEAIEMVESDEHPDNSVIEELQRGYKLKDRLLRPSMVRVAKNR
ncbi:MAG: nucleotide exchange factor GrpE [Acidobacteriaceae bacterium]